ncbi:hypothetical protein QCD60_15725 [Pokkaliibacter sp. MBI-7]|uniref:LPD29 domain-containing protein n=1 Tax=Pokkaliibacter sp. MBI-7 TaxID=3040600 RepID=UPI00244C1DA6|nr:LPD29 domain-containing protein [Pokkaliibacter sp. MBI-7]MDH2434016.1 hypothetical protein [Pokkaliibacter sp. MBI-7]
MNSLPSSTLSLIQDFNTEVRRLRNAEQYRHLHCSGSGDLYSSKLAAKNIRATLKHTLPAVKFSVRMDGFIAVNVSWDNGPGLDDVEGCIEPFRICVEHNNKPAPWYSISGRVKPLYWCRKTSVLWRP